MKIKYIKQKIKMFCEVANVESLAKLYFESLGYEVYYSKEIKYCDEKSWYSLVKDLELKGIPDLLLYKNDKISFCEVKRCREEDEHKRLGHNSDSLRLCQLDWIQKNPSFEVIVFSLSYTVQKAKEIKELEREIESLTKSLEDYSDKVNSLTKELEALKRLNNNLSKVKQIHIRLIEDKKSEILNKIKEVIRDSFEINEEQMNQIIRNYVDPIKSW